MLQFLNPWMLLGIAALCVPLGVHFLHRYRMRSTPFTGMRFLDQIMIRLQRRLRWQGLRLLSLRCALLVFLALALSQPLWRSHQDYRQILARHGAAAAVILFDNSASATKQLPALKQLAHQYINTLRSGDAVSIRSVNNQDSETLYDFKAAHTIIDRLQSCDAAGNLSQLFQQAQQNLDAHVNPLKEIILISDGQRNAWDAPCLHQLQQLQQKLTQNNSAARFVLLMPPPIPGADNSGIKELRSAQDVVSAGQRCLISITIQHAHVTGQRQCTLRIKADGRVIDERIITRKPNSEEVVQFAHSFSEPGSHYVSAELVGLRDALDQDNQRFLSVAVIKQTSILLIDSFAGKQLRLFALALQAQQNQQHQQSVFDVHHAAITEIKTDLLNRFQVLVLANTAALDSQSIAAIERYVVGGGNLMVLLGQYSQAQVINNLWSRGGDGFLPCTVEPARDTTAKFNTFLQFYQPQHPAFAHLPKPRQQLFSGCTIYKYMPLDINNVSDVDATHLNSPSDSQAHVLMTLSTGEPYLVERRRGQGRVLLFASDFNFDWSDVASHAIFVPWIRGLCAYLSSFLLPTRNLLCGEHIVHLRDDPSLNPASPAFITGGGKTVAATIGSWQGHQVMRSGIIWQAGFYAARTNSHSDQTTWYAVNLPASEQSLDRLQPAQLENFNQQLSMPLLRMRSPAEIQQNWGTDDSNTLPLWRIGLLLAIGLLVLESWYTRHLALRERAL